MVETSLEETQQECERILGSAKAVLAGDFAKGQLRTYSAEEVTDEDNEMFLRSAFTNE